MAQKQSANWWLASHPGKGEKVLRGGRGKRKQIEGLLA